MPNKIAMVINLLNFELIIFLKPFYYILDGFS